MTIEVSGPERNASQVPNRGLTSGAANTDSLAGTQVSLIEPK